MKARELIRDVEQAGAVFLRARGDDRLYRMPDGSIIGIPVGGRQSEVSTGCLGEVRRAMKRAGIAWGRDEKARERFVPPRLRMERDPKGPSPAPKEVIRTLGPVDSSAGLDCPKCSKPGKPVRTSRVRVPAGTRLPIGPGRVFHVAWPADLDYCCRCRGWYPSELGGRARLG